MSMPAALARRLQYAGPALFSYGFRPFFLGGAIWSALAIVVWIPLLSGHLQLRTAFSPLDWHVHEMLFGYVAAIIAGFLLTAIPNWTGRLPICGAPLALLADLWLAGRIAIFFSAELHAVAVAAIDLSFLVLLAGFALREIIAGKNWRNLRAILLVGVLIAANAVFHAEVLTTGSADYAIRLGIGAVVGLITLIGGRIIPSFTRNWLARRTPGRTPAPFSRFDAATIVASLIALASWIALPEHIVTGVLLLLAAGLQAIRLARWAGDRTLDDRLVLILHIGYSFVPLGFALGSCAVLAPDLMPASAGVHAWTAGAMGVMTLAVMTRATLGHTGHGLKASIGTQAIYALAVAAAVLRIAAAIADSMALMHVAAAFWIAAFGGFALLYGPLLAKRPPVWAGRG